MILTVSCKYSFYYTQIKCVCERESYDVYEEDKKYFRILHGHNKIFPCNLHVTMTVENF